METTQIEDGHESEFGFSFESGFGDGSGSGFGDGSGDGSGFGDGDGYESGDGDGIGSVLGFGSGDGFGDGFESDNSSTFSDQTLEELGELLIESIKLNFRARNISITNEQLKMIFEQSLNDIVRMAESYSEKRKED